MSRTFTRRDGLDVCGDPKALLDWPQAGNQTQKDRGDDMLTNVDKSIILNHIEH